MAIINLSENKGGFTLVPQGEQILTVTSAKAVPTARPETIVIEFSAPNGGTVKSNFDLNRESSMVPLSIFIRLVFDNQSLSTFDTAQLPQCVGKKIKAEIKHTIKDRISNGVKVEGQTSTFANISKFLEAIKEEPTPTTPSMIGGEMNLDDL